MQASIADLVRETTGTTGDVPSVTLSREVDYARFSDALAVDETTYYVIASGNDKEVGIGTYRATDILERTTPLITLVNEVYSTNTPARISLVGTSIVAIAPAAEILIALDSTLAGHIANASNPHGVTATQVPYDPNNDPVTSGTNLQSAMLDQSLSIEERVPSSSGVITGGNITGGGTTFSVTAGTGDVVNNYAIPDNTAILNISWLEALNVTLITAGETAGIVRIFVNSSGAIIQAPGPLNYAQYRDNIYLGNIYHMGGAITDVANSPAIVKQTATDSYDLMLSTTRLTGSGVFPVDNALSAWVGEGALFYPGINWGTDRTNPNNVDTAQIGSNLIPVAMATVDQDGVIGAEVTVFPQDYNPTGSALTGLSNNRATIHRLYSLGVTDGNRKLVLLYGQFDYGSAQEARDSLVLDTQTTIYPDILDDMTQLATVCVSGNANDFTDLSRAWIVSTSTGTTTSGGTASIDHTALFNRDSSDQHPIESIGTLAGEQLRTTLDAKMVWKGEWFSAEYYKNDVVRDGAWTMVANKTTTDRAGVQTVGSPKNYYAGTLSDTSAIAKQVRFGARFTLDITGYLNSTRVYLHADLEYSVVFALDPLGTPKYTELFSGVPADTGWVTYSINPELAAAGTVFDVVVIAKQVDASPVTWSGNWDYDTPNNSSTPTAGEVVHSNSQPELLAINVIDDIGGNRAAELAALAVGDTISSQGLVWNIQSTTDNATYFDFIISPATQAPADGIVGFEFQTIPATVTPYSEDIAYFNGSPVVQGLIAIDSPTLTIDANAYGVDIEMQAATISPDWDVLATSEGATSSGSEGGSSAASDVSYAPTGNVGATDVQAAITELDTEKAGLAETESITGGWTFENSPVFGKATTTVVDNFDSLMVGGAYNVNSLSNAPEGLVGWFYVQVYQHTDTDDYILQRATTLVGDPKTYERTRSVGVWGSWIRIPVEAIQLPYDNVSSGLTATEVQSAIDEVASGGAVGGGGDAVFYENDQNVTTSYTITAGKNAMSAGDIVIDNGAVITVPTGSRWVVV